MAIAIDVVILAIVALTTFIGYKQGLMKSIIKILSFFIALILAVTLYKTVANVIIEKTNIDEGIENIIVRKVVPEDSNEEQENVNLEARLSKILKTNAESSVKVVATALTIKIIQLIVFILIFIIVNIALRIIALITDLIAKIPFIKQFNELGGAIYGFLKGLLIVFTILAIITLASPILGSNFMEALDNSILGAVMYKNNLILMLI